MKRLLLPLLATLTLPSVVNAESYWLVLRWKFSSSGGLEKIEMNDLDQCNTEGKKWEQTILTKEETIVKREVGGKRSVSFGYSCVIGK